MAQIENKRSFRDLVIPLLILIVAIVEQFATDCYLPAFPAMMKSFATTQTAIQNTLSLFLFGEALAQPFFGFLSDLHGRRPLFILGISIFTLGSFLSLFAPSVQILWVGRLIQGFGVGSGIVLARAIAKDLFSSETTFAQMVSVISALIILLQLSSPIIGGYIQHHLGWHAIFLLITILAIILAFIVFLGLPETFHPGERMATTFVSLVKAYFPMIKSRIFWVNLSCGTLGTSVTIIYLTITPFLYQHILNLSVILFGWITACISIGLAIGVFLNAVLVKKWGLTRLIRLGAFISFISLSTMLVFALTKQLNLWVVLIPMCISTIGSGLMSANFGTNAMTPFPKLAGGAAAIYGGFQFFGASLSASIASLVHSRTQLPLSLLLFSTIFIIVIMLLSFRHDY